MYDELIHELELHIDPDFAARNAHFFGIAPGKYGEGDIYLGINTPILRKICTKYKQMPEEDVLKLLHSEVHDFRFAALAILSAQYKKNPDHIKDLFLENLEYINNWDLIDSFSRHILGRWCLEHHDESKLVELSYSLNFWHRRIAIVSYLAYYTKKVLGEHSLDIIDWNLEDEEPLVHKACGWMLRNIYTKIDKHLVESYIIDNYARMPRACLRNAIERMPEEERQRYLKGQF